MTAYRVYCTYCLIVSALRAAYWTAAVYFYISVVGLGPFRLVLVGTTVISKRMEARWRNQDRNLLDELSRIEQQMR